jgi:hypothetical protein
MILLYLFIAIGIAAVAAYALCGPTPTHHERCDFWKYPRYTYCNCGAYPPEGADR